MSSKKETPAVEDVLAEDSPSDDALAEHLAESGKNPIDTENPAENPLQQLAACEERILRLQAEMQNVRERTARELSSERKFAALPMARDLLEVVDNVDRAINAAEKSADAANLLEGFRMVGQQLRSVLDRHHVKPILAEGEPFDPNRHEAILQQPSPDHEAGIVMMETQPGWELHERVVRPSQVIVSSGPAE